MNLRHVLIAAAGVAASATGAQAANISQSAQANATIVQPSSMTAARSLEFGTIALPTSGTSTVEVSSASTASQTPTISGGGNAYNVTTGAARSAQFHLNGEQNHTFTISSTSLTISGLSGAATVTPTVTGATESAGTYTLTTGSAEIYVGGKFDLTPSTAAGAYTGTVNLQIAYN